MNYAPCMWSIDIGNGKTTERTYVLIHTDDIDGGGTFYLQLGVRGGAGPAAGTTHPP
eukprot:COSAG04_NODE_56_length_30604_cov_692.571119_20_plen_57_part_00